MTTTFSADLSAFQNIGTATYDESALPENDASNPEDEIGGRAIYDARRRAGDVAGLPLRG